MDISRMKELAGVEDTVYDNEMLNEFAVVPEDADLMAVAKMLDAAKRGLGLANQMQDPAQRSKHVRAVFINLNKIRAALARQLRDDGMNVEDPATTQVPQTTPPSL